jgi:hypothetical protein
LDYGVPMQHCVVRLVGAGFWLADKEKRVKAN